MAPRGFKSHPAQHRVAGEMGSYLTLNQVVRGSNPLLPISQGGMMEFGRRAALKMPCPYGRVGSNPTAAIRRQYGAW